MSVIVLVVVVVVISSFFVDVIVVMVVIMVVIVIVFVVMTMAVPMIMIMLIVRAVIMSMAPISVPRAFLSTSVDVTALTRVKDLNLNQVEKEGCNRDDEHDLTTDFRFFEETHGSFIEQPDCHYPDSEN